MKKINVLFLAIAAVIIAACSKPTMEEQANVLLPKLLDEKLNKMEMTTYKIINQTTVFAGDSICIIQFDLQGRNIYGFNVSIPMEYVLGWTIRTKDIELCEACYPIDSKTIPVLAFVKQQYGDYLPTDSKGKEEKVRIISQLRTCLLGRKVKEE